MNSTLDYLATRSEYINDKPPLRISLLRIVPRRIVIDSGVADRVTRPSLYPRSGLLSLPTASSSDQTRLCCVEISRKHIGERMIDGAIGSGEMS